MKVLKQFGDIYTFPDTQISYNDNFRELLTRTQRVPGGHGGFDQLGDERGLSEVGSVQAAFWLEFNSEAEAAEMMDTIGLINDAGVQRLFMQHYGTMPLRWCWARLNNQQQAQSVLNMPHKRQRVPLSFEISDPFWYTPGNGAVWGGGWLWSDGTLWGGDADATTNVTGLSTDLTFTNNGNAFTLPKITIRPPTGESVQDPIIRRIVAGEVVDEVKWLGKLEAEDSLVIIPDRHAVYLNSVAIYSSVFQAKNAHWMRLLPGANTLRVLFGDSGDEADVTVRYLERYV